MTPASTQKSIAFWLAARLVAALTLVAVAFTPWRPMRGAAYRYGLLALALLVSAAVYGLVLGLPERLPLFYRPGHGLTPVKLGLEGLVMALTALSAFGLWRRRDEIREINAEGLAVGAALLVVSSLALSLYSDVHDAYSLIGHLYKLGAYYAIYRLVFVASVRRPYDRVRAEIAQNEAMRGRLRTLEYFDALTGLPNRRHLHESASRALESRRYSGARVALLIADVDRFTVINEAQGHAFGDVVLKIAGERMSQLVGTRGSVYRFGADEFAVLVELRRHDPPLGEFADRLLAEVGAPMTVLGAEIAVSLSIGASLAPDDADSFDRLLQNAETALHAARVKGSGSWRRFDASLNDEVVGRLNLRAGLRRALERGEFRVYYQPQLDLADGRIVGAEALLRWQHPEQGLILPGRFIQEAEESGLILPLSEWVLDEACHQAAAWRRAGLVLPRIAVNVSARQIERPDFEWRVQQALESSGLSPEALELELTESMLVRDTEAVLGTLQRLKARGLCLALDDFGTGYSSLGYLRAFPIDTLKIDQTFVRELLHRTDNRAIVSAILQLAHAFGMQTLAEGVEDEDTARLLRELGCGQAQGFLYGKAEPAESFAGRLQGMA